MILYRQVRTVKSGQVERFEINYTPEPQDATKDGTIKGPGDVQGPGIVQSLWVKVKNVEPLPMRAAFIAGPYLLYVDCRSDDYNMKEKCFITANQPKFESQLQPGKSFYSELSCHTFKDTYKWTVDVVSQMIFNSNMEINFEITIGTSKETLHDAAFSDKKVPNSDRIGTFTALNVLRVCELDTYDLWNLPVPNPQKPIHLVILTHGLHSNVSADMLYLKEQIDSTSASPDSKENVIVKGYFGNICKTERGIKYLGSRVAEFVIDLVTNNELFNDNKVTKISFVGHSLGGLVQTFAIAYLQNNFPWFFQKIRPINFITIASPMLGASNDNPIYVNLALLAGIVGKTGQDLSLRFTEDSAKPLLLLLPSGPTHQILKRFLRRTVYANTANDGVVPLRTSALLYLDYDGLSSVLSEQAINSHHISKGHLDKIPDDECADNSNLSFLPQPVQMFLAKFLPQKQKEQAEDTKEQDDNGEVDDDPATSTKKLLKRIEGLPKSSVFETASSLILPPLPQMSYIVNPEERENAIIYDKVYTEEDLPPRDEADLVDDKARHIPRTEGINPVINKEVTIDPSDTTAMSQSDSVLSETAKVSDSQVTKFRKRLFSTIDFQDFEKIEEEIAREYHKAMSWRKVLVRLRPDAHNSIIVRRRFANAYGWPVIEHLVNNHFGKEEEEVANARWRLDSIGLLDNDSLSEDIGLNGILSRDLISKENKNIEMMSKKEDTHQWINTKDEESFFSVGPAGMISDVSEMVGNLRDQWYNTQASRLQNKESESKEYESDLKGGLMGDFI